MKESPSWGNHCSWLSEAIVPINLPNPPESDTIQPPPGHFSHPFALWEPQGWESLAPDGRSQRPGACLPPGSGLVFRGQILPTTLPS